MDPELIKCFEERKLRREKPKPTWVQQSMAIAHKKLSEAERALSLGVYEYSLIGAYTAMFHASRALLFRDGIIEKSHYCMIRYLLDRYGTKIEKRFLWLLDEYRERRHELLYGLSPQKITEELAREALETAKQFLEVVENLLEEKE